MTRHRYTERLYGDAADRQSAGSTSWLGYLLVCDVSRCHGYIIDAGGPFDAVLRRSTAHCTLPPGRAGF